MWETKREPIAKRQSWQATCQCCASGVEPSVRPGRILIIAMTALTALGLTFVGVGLTKNNGLQPTGPILLLLAATGGLMHASFGRRHLEVLVEQIRRPMDGGDYRHISAPAADLVEVANAVNDLLNGAGGVASNASIRAKELEIQLKVATAERQHAEAIIYSISDAVLVTDIFDDLVLANEAAARTFDFDLADAMRSPVEQVLSDQKVIDMIREMRQSNSISGRRIVEHTVTTPTGGARTYKITLSCVADKTEQHPAGVVAVLHDMTKEKEVAEMKNDFVSNVSHELRTPLASIKAYIEMLIDGEADDEKTKTEFYEVIQNESNRLSRLIDNILNISRIESGLTKVNKQPQSL